MGCNSNRVKGLCDNKDLQAAILTKNCTEFWKKSAWLPVKRQPTFSKICCATLPLSSWLWVNDRDCVLLLKRAMMLNQRKY